MYAIRSYYAPQGLEDPRCPQAGDVAGVLGDVEGDANVALRPEVVDLVGAYVVDEVGHLPRVGEVAVMEEQLRSPDVGVDVDMVDAAGVERGGAPYDTVHLVSFH